MDKYITENEWSIIEEGFDSERNEVSESLCSIGNGHMGQRANFEEHFSGPTLQGSYIGGVYYPDKTKVGWWKNGYPDYFAKVLNSTNWIGLDIHVNDEQLDLFAAKSVQDFKRELDMCNGILKRTCQIELNNGAIIAIDSTRFVSIVDEEIGMICYKITALSDNLELKIESFLDGDVSNQDSNYGEKFWIPKTSFSNIDTFYLENETKKTNFVVGVLAHNILVANDGLTIEGSSFIQEESYVSQIFKTSIAKGESLTLYKYVILANSRNHEPSAILSHSQAKLATVVFEGFHSHLDAHAAAWHKIWKSCDIVIDGDVSAQQGVRFNIFQLLQTYSGKDSRLNIGPKGFTGEKYGGSTYWDTEAYCLPFYMSASGEDVARNLLKYRYDQLDKAIENAVKLGFKDGAALYPMVTMNGEECHNEWEITFEEIHRNGAIAYAIFDYTRYTGDNSYLYDFGLEVLVAISKFWEQRVNWSFPKNKYVILGVTGPNEYENNVNNNWYTNFIAKWCLEYTLSVMEQLESFDSNKYKVLVNKTGLLKSQLQKWQKISSKMYLPYSESDKIYLQQDGFLDKELISANKITLSERPINKHWSWDRILRSCFIKQADVLQGMYFFEDKFDDATIQRHFAFYEPMTVHESSLSPCVHSILACKIGDIEKAYEMYQRTARLDLDNYNHDTDDGLHITSMAGSWLSLVKGFGGMRIKDGGLHFQPVLPDNWTSLSFNIIFRKNTLKVTMRKNSQVFENLSGSEMQIWLNNIKFDLESKSQIVIGVSKLHENNKVEL